MIKQMVISAALLVRVVGCADPAAILPKLSIGWHAHVGWRAQDYFEDPKVIELCKAIEANDLAKMRAVIASGADVKAIGKDGMTPLLWAFPENHFERFELLLRAGADLESPYYLNGNPAHLVLWKELSIHRSAEVREQHKRLVDWIALQGVDLGAARADINRWRSAINHVNPEASARKQMEELKIRAKAENRETSFEYQ